MSPTTALSAGAPLLSLVVPIFNEAETLPVFHQRATRVLRECCETYEILFVNDGSNDGSAEELRRLAAIDPHVKVVSLSRNFGHQTAVTAGLNYSNGAAVAVIDGDLQDPPELIPEMLARWRDGFEVVYAIRRSRREGWLKRTTYRLYYRLLRSLSSVNMPLDAGDFAVMDRRVVELLNEMPERNRFVRGIRAWVGFRQTGIAYDRDRRFAGESKYPLTKLLRLAYDGLVSYSFLPLRVVTQLGLVISLVACALMLYALGRWVVGAAPPAGSASTLVVVLFLGGVQLVSVGILGEYVARIFDEVRRRPLYVVRETVGFDAPLGPHRWPDDAGAEPIALRRHA